MALFDLWSRVDVIRDPQVRIDELVETKDYRPAAGATLR